MRRIHSSHSWLTPAARTAVKGARALRVHRSAAQTLYSRRSGGYARKRAGMPVVPSILCFQHVYAAVVPRMRFAARSERNSRLPAHFQNVTERYRVNAAVFAGACRAPLIPNTFTRVNARYLYSYPAGDDVSTFIRCERSAGLAFEATGCRHLRCTQGSYSWQQNLNARRRPTSRQNPNQQ